MPSLMSYALNPKEKVVLASFPEPSGDAKTGEFLTLEELAKRSFGKQKRGSSPKSQGNSWVRNSLRKLMALKLVSHAPGKSGKYARTKVSLKEIEEKRKESEQEKSARAEKRIKKTKAKAKASESSEPATE